MSIRSKTKNIEVSKIITLFGGKHQIVSDYEQILKTIITVKAVEKWIERGALPVKHILNFRSIAEKRQIEFNLNDYVR